MPLLCYKHNDGIHYNQGVNLVQNVFDQEGKRVTEQDIIKERIDPVRNLIEEKRKDFEAALDIKCRALDIPFSNMGYQVVGNVNDIVYQVGMEVYRLQATSNGVVPQKVGIIG